MASSSPSSEPPDTEECNCENKSTLKLSGDCLPCEELSSCEDIILLGDTTPTLCSSGDLLCPVKGRGKRCPKDKTKCTKGKPGSLVKLLNTFQSFHLNDEEIQRDDNKNHQKIQRKKKDEDCGFLELTMVEDPAQLSHQQHEVRVDSPICKPSGNTDVGPFPELPATPKGQERAERASEASSSHKSGTTEPSTSSAHLEDDVPRPPSTASRLMGWAFSWLHQRVLSMGCRRRGPEQATRSCPQWAPLRSRCLRGKRVHPDGPLSS
ncbi:hypothetical protein H920_04467 [Fukomys damarensis]|uniref:Uncharacterized protein n=1 Tax=Fukomys damarensis TaxID=885580 RepID=A0A091EFJ1_FUKDA|nr:hypothetical protein H920_04467 [Fukomys damarensis]